MPNPPRFGQGRQHHPVIQEVAVGKTPERAVGPFHGDRYKQLAPFLQGAGSDEVTPRQ